MGAQIAAGLAHLVEGVVERVVTEEGVEFLEWTGAHANLMRTWGFLCCGIRADLLFSL